LWSVPVSDIYQGFAHQLAAWQTRYAGRPEREMLHLYLLALEREENVAVAYDAAVLGPRLAAMHLPDGVRELIRRALLWVWKDEEMHAIYVRTALRRLDQHLLGMRTVLQQTAGAVGGWTVSVQQHRRWSDAPLSRSAATLLVWAGGVTGRVPREVRHHLRYSSFRDFCRYNVDTEGTAWLCWQRLTELAAQVPALSAAQVDDFRRVADDESRHRQIFKILAEALTDDDRLREGVTAEALTARIGAVGEFFLRALPLSAHYSTALHWKRRTVQRLLGMSQPPAFNPDLKSISRKGAKPPSRMQRNERPEVAW
jgi:hypothetical protein